MNISDVKKCVGMRMAWEDHSNRYVFERSGILDDVYRGQLSFDGNKDYRPLSEFKNIKISENG